MELIKLINRIIEIFVIIHTIMKLFFDFFVK